MISSAVSRSHHSWQHCSWHLGAASALFLAVTTVAVLPATKAALALTSQEKMETCKFGADDQNLKGGAHKAFIKKCMSNADSPAPKAVKKKKT